MLHLGIMKLLLYLLPLVLISCNGQPEKPVEQTTAPKATTHAIKLHPLTKLFTIGDFDGDGKQDTLFQHNYSGITNSEIEYAADPFENEWDTVVNWFYKQEVHAYLTLNKSNPDTLSLGTVQGLYCLLNIGDNNKDGKDEIALVVDHLDYSRVNSCKIYSLCNNKWTLLKQFGVHEGAFDFTAGDTIPLFHNIKDHLEKQKGQWVYKDYLQDGYDNMEDAGKMFPLKLSKCK